MDTSTVKAVTTCFLKLDQALNRMDGEEDTMNSSPLLATFSLVLEVAGQCGGPATHLHLLPVGLG